MQVLLIDDDPLMHEMVPAVLRKALSEVEVVVVADLEAAFRHLAHHKSPDLALLDLGLPGHAGIDTLRRFRWKFSKVPVVVLSATEDPAAVRVADQMGAAGYIPKSTPAERMVEALKRIAEGGRYFPAPRK